MRLKKFLGLPLFLALMQSAYAHCPLCTIGAAAAAGGAAWLGVSKIVIGVFIGAFAVSIGWWISNLIKKQYIPFQKPLIILFSFLTTVFPLLGLEVMRSNYPLLVSFFGDYGSLLNRTYILNLFLVGSILGGLIVSITPWFSIKITKLRDGKMLPYQGILLTFLLLVISSAIIEAII
ncbi:hypothetical protein HYU50_00375 [Candidatus Woesearchaeota archaeon]|nr:hypothetical protein [Candidatus Woesearchaeota archaeon]